MTYHLKPLSAALLIALAHNVQAEKKYHYDIPPQPLSAALQSFSEQSGVPMLYTEASAQGKYSSGLNGDYSSGEALERLIDGSGLIPAVATDGTITLKSTGIIKTATDGSDQTLPKVMVEADSESQTYDPDWDRDTRNPSYNRTHTTTATKTDTPIMETPWSIQVVPKKILDDQQAYDIKEALKNVSGIQQSTSPSDYVNLVIRGFDASGAVYKNGIRQDSFAEETSNLERIEVLKGPAAMLYGRIEPGGLVNLQTARPSEQPYYSLQQQFGSYDFYRTTLDATGPITQDKSLLYRLNFAYRDNESYRDLSFKERIFLAPAVTWNISDRTQANLLLEYQNDDYRADYGFPAVGNWPAQLPITRSLSDPAAHDAQESQRIFADWSHEFNDKWKLSHRFMAGFTDYEQFDLFTLPPEAGQTVYDRRLWGVHQDRDIYATNMDLTGHFDTWGAKHSVLFGFDYYFIDQLAFGHCCFLSGPASTVNSLNPVQGVTSASELENQPQDYFFANQQEWKGVYFQDQITLWDKLHILGGGRYDWVTFSNGFSGTSTGEAMSLLGQNEVDKEKFSPRVGILYQPLNWLSVYGNFTESLGGNNGNPAASGRPLGSQTAEQFEAGFKTELLDKRLTTSAAYFHITKQNIQSLDTVATTETGTFFYKAIGEAVSQGLEVDVSGQLSDNWNIIASYAYTDTEITSDTSCLAFNDPNGTCSQPGIGNTGNRLPNAALHSGSLWTTYDFDNSFGQNWLSGLSLGTGVFVVGQREGDFENTFQLPGYVRWDASASYKWDIGKSKLTAQLNVRNILDKRYFSGADTYDAFQRGYGNIPGEPLTFLGFLKLEY